MKAILCVPALLFLLESPSQDADRRIESLLQRLVAQKDEAARAPIRAELDAIGKPILSAVHRLLEEELGRDRKSHEQADAVVEKNLPALDHDQSKVREAATLAIVELGDAAFPALRKHGNHPSPEVRGRLKTIEEMIDARQKAGPRIREEAIHFFSRHSKDPSSAAVFAVGFESRNPRTRLAALKAWSEAALPDDLPRVKPLLSDPEEPIRQLAVRTAYDLGAAAAVPLLVDVVENETDRQLWMSATVLAARWRPTWTPDVTRRMAAILERAPAERRQHLIWAVFQSGFPLPGPFEVLADAIRKLSPEERKPLLKNWWFVGEQDAWRSIWRLLSEDPDTELAMRAAELHEQILFESLGGVEGFLKQWPQLPAATRTAGLRGYLRAPGENKPVHAIPAILREKDPELRKQLIDASFRDPKFVTGSVLRDALLSSVPDLVAAASDWTHPNTVSESRAALRYLHDTADDAAFKARLGVNLAAIGDPVGIPQIRPMLRTPQLALRALQAIKETRAPGFLEEVTPLLKSPAREIRRAAAEALIACGDSRAMDALWDLKNDDALATLVPQAFGVLGRASDLEKLEKLIVEKPALKVYLPNALMSWSPAKPVPLLTALARDDDARTRENAQKVIDQIRKASTFLADLAAAPRGNGLPASFAGLLAPMGSFRFAFAPADRCTAEVAEDLHAVPLPVEDFLRIFNPSTYAHFTVFASAAGKGCPPELLETIRPDHPRVEAMLRLVRYHPCADASRRLAALPLTRENSSIVLSILAQGDPVLARSIIVGGLKDGTAVEPGTFIQILSHFMPPAELVPLAEELSTSPHPKVAEGARTWLSTVKPEVLREMEDRGRLRDRSSLYRSLAFHRRPEDLPPLEAALDNPSAAIRGIAATSLLRGGRRDAIPIALALLKDAEGEAAWELAAALAPWVAPEHRPLLSEDAASPAVHAVLARLGRKQSAARLLSAMPTSEKGWRAAAWGLASHLDPDIEKLLLAAMEARKDPHTHLTIAMALTKSPHADTRTRIMGWLKKIALYQDAGRIDPAYRLALETLIDRGEPGALERAAMYGSYGVMSIKEESIALVSRAKSDEAAALLLGFLNTSTDEARKVRPGVLEAIREMPKGPKTREKLRDLLTRNTLSDLPALLPLFVELGEETALEEHVEKSVRKVGPFLQLAPLDLLSRTTNGKERLRRLAQDLTASKDSDARLVAGLALFLSGGTPDLQAFPSTHLQQGLPWGTYLAGELRRVDLVDDLRKKALERLPSSHDSTLNGVIPLLTCSALRLPVPATPGYGREMSLFIRDLTIWTRSHRGMTFEAVFAQALRARGYAVAGDETAAADAEALVAALEDRDPAIAVNSAWMLQRLFKDPPVARRLAAVEEGFGMTLLRPSPVEIAAWKRWLDTRK
jgi:HEAT repeat protein